MLGHFFFDDRSSRCLEVPHELVFPGTLHAGCDQVHDEVCGIPLEWNRTSDLRRIVSQISHRSLVDHPTWPGSEEDQLVEEPGDLSSWLVDGHDDQHGVAVREPSHIAHAQLSIGGRKTRGRFVAEHDPRPTSYPLHQGKPPPLTSRNASGALLGIANVGVPDVVEPESLQKRLDPELIHLSGDPGWALRFQVRMEPEHFLNCQVCEHKIVLRYVG
mmetsp:Transcript_46881/g.109515  ORF Transcript_46881/g.109515 Transcript_46881/m.109515 type:complete len:216 (-) Transcript_46881:628-1275(-)